MSPLRRALATAALSLVPGCFSDGGAVLTHTATSIEPGTSTSSAATTSAAPDPGTTQPEPTSSGPEPGTTSTTGEPVTTGTTADVPLCPGEMQCSPGDVRDTGALCEPCGRIRQTCQDDCTWGGDACVEDLSSCAFWHFDGAWTRVSLPQPAPPHAPSAPVIAAFELYGHGRIFALTQTTYHVLADDHTWIASGPRAELLPDFTGELLQAYAVDNGDETYTVYAVGDPEAALYTLPAGGFQAEYMYSSPCCNSFTEVKPSSLAAVRDLYIDLNPPFPWTGGQFYGECINDVFDLTIYGAWITPSDIYVQDGVCFKMIYQTPLTEFPPFAAPGAPPGQLVGGVALLAERLYVFAGE